MKTNSLCRLATATLVALLLTRLAVPNAHAVTIDWVTVGDPGNTADSTGYGAVTDVFNIMKYEWTNSQYIQFLNAVDPQGTNPNEIWNANMEVNARGGIVFTSASALGGKYTVKANMGDKPVNYVTWWDAARAVNWLQKGAQSYGSSDATASAPQNSGAYAVGTATFGTAPAKSVGAQYWLPTTNEWYKAAFYKGGGTSAGYWDYGTASDTAPTTVTSGTTGIGSAGSTGNFANFNSGASWNGQTGNLTTVGTNGRPSPYGAFDMSGNVQEWTDLSGTPDSSRGIRGGMWFTNNTFLLSANWDPTTDASNTSDGTGFRVAAVPEPASLGLAATGGLAALGWTMLRRRKRVSGLPRPAGARG